ncbi:MAG: LysM peptidoglycan-binding domain-containing protein [Acidobacteria bacterium]|nr:LysM peptidoglycan-binding domain-containing protein [Acidobacteriota bacterium]
MKISRFPRVLAASAVLIAGVGCQTAHKPASRVVTPRAAPPPDRQPPQNQASVGAKTPPIQDTAPQNAPPSAPAPAQKLETGIAPDPVAGLVARVEKEYQAGLEQYKAGQKDAAREHFDRAFNLLLGSPAELRRDPRFQTEFDRVLENENQLETAVLDENESAPEKKAEPAPIDEANEVTNYPVDPSLKAKATAEIKAMHSDLPLMMTDQVAGYINYFSSRGRGTLERGLALGGRYRAMIERVLKEEGVPQDLIYLAQAESGFHPDAVSRAGARGMWQFMGSRARAYDLYRDPWIDERQDPEKSTRAAARHLRDLYNEFGDWYLAMAAYNSGPGTVQNAVKRTGYADFWELYRRNVLPLETRNYVPIILAETIMAKNPSQYGLEGVVPDAPMSYDTVRISYPVDLRLVAQCVNASPQQLQELNPSLLRMTTPRRRFDLHLPAGTKRKYEAGISRIPVDMRLWWRYHTAQKGDTLMSVARTYRTPMKTIAQANELRISDTIEPGARLIIPIAPGAHTSGDSQTYARRLTVYHIRKKDTLQSISNNLGIAPQTIRRWNHLKSNSLKGRRVLYVHLPVSPTLAADRSRAAPKSKRNNSLAASGHNGRIHHTVKRGETLSSIATNYKTSVKAIKQTNSNVAVLRPGMVLVIPAQ